VVDAAGIPLVGAQLFSYATGTATFQNTYNDVGLTIANANPVLTNSMGMFPQVFLVAAPAYRLRLEDAAGSIIWDCDPCSGVPTSGYGGSAPGYVPIGSIMPFGGGSPPSGWMLCDGSDVSRTTFAPLFAVIGTTFGSGDGATTFNIPDLRGNVAVGQDNMGGVAAGRITSGNSGVNGATLGTMGGSELLHGHFHNLTDPGHNHTDSGHTHNMGPNLINYPVTGGGLQGGGNYHFDFPITSKTDSATANIQSNTTGITVAAAGNGASQNVQPSIITSYIIFYA
jgi:microcystin-dependent protein